MSAKPSLPKGTRDFGPAEMARRNFIFRHIRETFVTFGFMPLETPAMENLEVLTGKYGDEGDTLLYRILDSGDFLKNTTSEDYDGGASRLSPLIAGKGLKYDLTVPFARYTVMNQHEITLPFKRYQIQPVWRADRPQRGRYREFYQCDADVIGTDSLLCEAEIIVMINTVFEKLGITDYEIKINHRRLLKGITGYIGADGMENEFCVAIDKLDKIGRQKVYEEMNDRGISSSATSRLDPFMELSGSNQVKLDRLAEYFQGVPDGLQGIGELREVLALAEKSGADLSKVALDITLARGLSYYTGTIFEVKVNNVSIGSVSGGGRYDDLTGVFGLPGMSGVGFSFGVDRIYDVMTELDLFPAATSAFTAALVITFDAASWDHGIGVVARLRKAGISAELYPEAARPRKQFAYADKKNIPYTVIIGENERQEGTLTIKNMLSGNQETLQRDQAIEKLRKDILA